MRWLLTASWQSSNTGSRLRQIDLSRSPARQTWQSLAARLVPFRQLLSDHGVDVLGASIEAREKR